MWVGVVYASEVFSFIWKCECMKPLARWFLCSSPIPLYLSWSTHSITSCVIMIKRTPRRHFSETLGFVLLRSICKCAVADCWEIFFLVFLNKCGAERSGDVRATQRCSSPLRLMLSGFRPLRVISLMSGDGQHANTWKIRASCVLLDISHASVTDELPPNVSVTSVKLIEQHVQERNTCLRAPHHPSQVKTFIPLLPDVKTTKRCRFHHLNLHLFRWRATD